MQYELYAFVRVEDCTEPTESGIPARGVPLHPRHIRVLVETYDTKQLAEWWAINMKRVWLDPEKTVIVPEAWIMKFEIVEVP